MATVLVIGASRGLGLEVGLAGIEDAALHLRLRMGKPRPFGDALLRDLRVKILPHHDLRLAPATVERIGKSEVLPNDGAGATGKTVRGGKLGHLLGEKRHIGGLQRDLAARGPHRDAKIGAGQCGGVIHPIADKGQLAACGQLGDQMRVGW